MEEQANDQCLFVLLPREIQLMVVAAITDVDDLLSLVQVAMFNHVLNKDGFIIREVWRRIAKDLHWNISDTSNAWIKRTAKKVGSGRYCLYCGRVTQAKIPLSWMAEYNIKRRICLDCFTGRKGVGLITKSLIRVRFPQLPFKKLAFLEWRYGSDRDQEYLLSQVERLATGEYVPPTEFRTAFELHYKSSAKQMPGNKKNNNANSKEPKKKSSKLLKEFGNGSKPTPVSTKISPFNNSFKQNNSNKILSNAIIGQDTEINNNSNIKNEDKEKKEPIVIDEDDDFQAPKINKKLTAYINTANTNISKNKPKISADPLKKQRKAKPKASTAASNSNLMTTLVSLSKNNEEKSVMQLESTSNDVVVADLIDATKETNITSADSLQSSSSSITSNSNVSETSTSADPTQLIKPKISKKRSVKPKATATTNNDLSLSTSLKTPFKRPRRAEDQSPTDENGVAIPSPKKRLKKTSQSPTKLIGSAGDSNITGDNKNTVDTPNNASLAPNESTDEKLDLHVNGV